MQRQLQLFQSQAGARRNTREHSWTNLVAIVKREHRIGISIASEDLVRARFTFHDPLDAEQRGQHRARFLGTDGRPTLARRNRGTLPGSTLRDTRNKTARRGVVFLRGVLNPRIFVLV